MTSELEAKIKLLDDPDDSIFKAVRKSLIDEGKNILTNLEETWSKNLNPIVQERIEDIIKTIQFNDIQQELTQWKNSNGIDLAYGAYIVAKYLYYELKWEDIENKIETIRKDVWLELNQELTALEKVRILNHILYDIHQFNANVSNINSPQYYYINNAFETKKAHPITIAIIYISIAQRLNLPIFGVDLPKNFVAGYVDQLSAFEAFGENIDTPVLFYINPFNKGWVFSRKEIDIFLKQAKIEPQASFYSPCHNIKVIERLITNLLITYEQMGYNEKANELSSLLKILM
ncbi:MAG: hypothetical protein HPY79_00675 [Bacteroidales bacterium]|nr:hypothetical protein [Bacteroidales bacterium]